LRGSARTSARKVLGKSDTWRHKAVFIRHCSALFGWASGIVRPDSKPAGSTHVDVKSPVADVLVNVPADKLKVGFTLFGGLVKVPFLHIDWGRWSKN
jgi:hypothetical protein